MHANLLKQIPSGVGKGFAWGRSRIMKSFKSTFEQADESADAELEDLDVGADALLFTPLLLSPTLISSRKTVTC